MGDYYGWKTGVLENNHVRLEYLTQAGPRIVRLSRANSAENLFAEVPDVNWPTSEGTFNIFGGHRLWHAPEVGNRTDLPDNSGVVVSSDNGRVQLSRSADKSGIAKAMSIQLHHDAAAVTVNHTLRNDNGWPVQLAPWAITQMRLGGTAIFPQQTEPLDRDGLLPNRALVLWPYARWDDARFQPSPDVIRVVGTAQPVAFKMGMMNRHGWLAYVHGDTCFRKTFTPQPDQPHADLGCNSEIYVKDAFLELETLGPLVTLRPGASASHKEVWELFSAEDLALLT
ncbi:MAG: hypothetical protein M9918_21965 [Anaerolineae bacterium]|nr:hypothetical protein [Anaerolineae bacterium]MCO5190837.1 hypothetical protein [Anaerolineae bacterium]